MRDYRDAKAMAKRLREALALKGLALSHSDCLELIARSFGLKDWHVLAALIDSGAPAAPPDPAPPAWSGPALLLRDVVAFPKLTLPLFLGRDMSVRALQNAYEGELEVLLITQRDRGEDRPTREGLYDIGVIADVLERTVLADNTVKLLVRGRQRATLMTLSTEDGVSRAEAVVVTTPAGAGAADEVAAAAVAFHAYAERRGDRIGAEVRGWAAGITHPGVLADLIAAHAVAPLAVKQAVLETLDAHRRLDAAVRLIAAAAEAA